MYVAIHFDVSVPLSKPAVLPVGRFHTHPMGVSKQYGHVVQQFIVCLLCCAVVSICLVSHGCLLFHGALAVKFYGASAVDGVGDRQSIFRYCSTRDPFETFSAALSAHSKKGL